MGIATGAGIAAGDLIHTFTAAVGISALLAASAALFAIIKYIGAGYLIYLGIRAILEKSPASLIERVNPVSTGKAFRQAIVTELFNPKTALFFLAFLPQLARPENGSVTVQLALLGIVFVLLGLISTVVYAASAGRMGQFLRRKPTVLKWHGKVVGGIHCAPGDPALRCKNDERLALASCPGNSRHMFLLSIELSEGKDSDGDGRPKASAEA